MMPTSKLFRLHVWGEFALFTRPEMKVERVSYEMMTPAAARGILEAILWPSKVMSDQRAQAAMSGYHDLVRNGRREMYKVES